MKIIFLLHSLLSNKLHIHSSRIPPLTIIIEESISESCQNSVQRTTSFVETRIIKERGTFTSLFIDIKYINFPYFVTSSTNLTTLSTVKPNFSINRSPFAEAPKRSMVRVFPSKPT